MAKPSLDELLWYASEAEAAPQFCRWYALCASHVQDAVDAAIIKGRQHSFVIPPYRTRFATLVFNALMLHGG